MGILQARILEWVAMPSSSLPNPRGRTQASQIAEGFEPRSPALQVDYLPSDPPEKPMNTRVGSLSLLQGIFLTQELNLGLLHCRKILYKLSYQGSPNLFAYKYLPSLAVRNLTPITSHPFAP
ncbi:unnamed protein product [Rangifer tarandus platyrhynchus]|uniref:Uncharacterized protein n=1 Tax=Rangifer tarandus platyrhynchus TaxID=3082113 RepID=A0AC59ZG42_RANTA